MPKYRIIGIDPKYEGIYPHPNGIDVLYNGSIVEGELTTLESGHICLVYYLGSTTCRILAQNLELIHDDIKTTCNCDIMILMSRGCTCGAILLEKEKNSNYG